MMNKYKTIDNMLKSYPNKNDNQKLIDLASQLKEGYNYIKDLRKRASEFLQ